MELSIVFFCYFAVKVCNYAIYRRNSMKILKSTLLPALLILSACSLNEADFLGYWVEVNGQYEYLDIDEGPQFKDGGEEGLAQALLEVLTYPVEARDNGIEGCVKLEYEISEEGTVENITVLSDPGGGLGEAARSALETVTEGAVFEPALLFGQPVRVLIEEEVCFTL
jgi:TonB family protein